MSEKPTALPPQQIKPSTKDFSEDFLISPEQQKPCVPQPQSQENNVLLDFGNLPSSTAETKKPENEKSSAKDLFSDFKTNNNQDLFSDFAVPPPSTNSTNSTSTTNIDNLLDISSSGPELITPMKTSSSAENFQTKAKNDPFDFLGLQPTKNQQNAPNNGDDLVTKMLNDLDMKPATASNGGGNRNGKNNINSTAKAGQGQPGPNMRPNYNVSFNVNGGGSQQSKPAATAGKKASASATFEDLLGQNFSFTPSANNANSNKSIGEMKKAETMKQMTPEEAKVFAWKDGKSRNLRALLCSLHTVIWSNSRWSQCGMHQLVNESDVGRMYKKACLAVHPDKQMGTENEELSKLIFIELNDAWAEFNKDS